MKNLLTHYPDRVLVTNNYPGGTLLGNRSGRLADRAGAGARRAGDVSGVAASGLGGSTSSSARRRIVATARHIILQRLPYTSRGGDEKEREEADHYRKNFPLHSQIFFQNNYNIEKKIKLYRKRVVTTLDVYNCVMIYGLQFCGEDHSETILLSRIASAINHIILLRTTKRKITAECIRFDSTFVRSATDL